MSAASASDLAGPATAYFRDLQERLCAAFEAFEPVQRFERRAWAKPEGHRLQGGGQSNGFSLGAGVTWLLNRHMRLSATYDFTDQTGSSNPALQTTGSYMRSIGLLTLRFAM